MIDYADALALVRATGARRPLPEELVPLERSAGRVAARALVSCEAVPGFDNAGMDGFAVRAGDVAGASATRPISLSIRGSLAAGDDPARVAGAEPGGAVEIMTGAPLPAGWDAVIRLEDVEVRRDAGGSPTEVVVRAPVEAGRHVRPAGEDFREGDVVAAAGTVLRPAHVMALATLGLAEVPVRRRPRIAIVGTGKEVVPYTERALPAGALRNSTTPYLRAALPSFGAECVSAALVGDDPRDLRAAIVAAAEGGADVVLTTGAVSAGKHDFVAEVLGSLGARIVFHKAAVRPGKPVLFAELAGGPALFGLPGNPVASAVSLRFLVVPFLRATLGVAPEVPRRARLAQDAHKPDGLRCFFKAVVRAGPDETTVEVLGAQGSSIVSSMLRANAWAVLPEEGSRCPAGQELEVVAPLGVDPGWQEAP